MSQLPPPVPPKKRAFDVVVVLLAAPLWLPAMFVSGLAILLLSGPPVLYWSRRRVAPRSTPPVAKFRTMVRNAERVANRNTIPIEEQRFLNIPLDSPLYTRIGRLVERLHLTETPQFLHVLSGKLCLVGNRPLPEDVIAALKQTNPHAEDRFKMRSGMTGPVQLIGRADISDVDRLALECEYCRVAANSYSLRLDLMILGMTLPVALRIMRPRTLSQVRHMMHAASERGRVRRTKAKRSERSKKGSAA